MHPCYLSPLKQGGKCFFQGCFSSQNIFSAAEEIRTYKQLRVEGLMTMLPHNQDTKTNIIRSLIVGHRRTSTLLLLFDIETFNKF